MLRFVCLSLCAFVLASCGASRSGTSSPLPPASGANAINGTSPLTAGNGVSVTEYPLPFDAIAAGITMGRGGTAWFASSFHMNRVNAGGKIRSFQSTQVGSYVAPSLPNNDPVVTAADGSVWFVGSVNPNDPSAITQYCLGQPSCSQPMRITQDGQITVMPVPAPLASNFVYNLAPGPDGTVWVLYTQAFSYQYRLAALYADGTAKFEKVLVQGAPFGGSPQPQGMAMGADGAMYISVALSEDTSEIQRFDANGTLTRHIRTGLFANHMVSGPDGALWLIPYTVGPQYNRVERVSLSGAYTDFMFPVVSVSLRAITAAADGALWISDGGNNAIWRVTTEGIITQYPMSAYGSGTMFSITARIAGHVPANHATLWFTQGNAAGKLLYGVPSAGTLSGSNS